MSVFGIAARNEAEHNALNQSEDAIYIYRELLRPQVTRSSNQGLDDGEGPDSHT